MKLSTRREDDYKKRKLYILREANINHELIRR